VWVSAAPPLALGAAASHGSLAIAQTMDASRVPGAIVLARP
jgi:hypothetical protein